MLEPNEVRIAPSIPQAELDGLEAQFDHAIRHAEESGEWPAKVYTARDLATPAGIRATIQRYRAAHWSVIEGGGEGIRATIYHPDREPPGLAIVRYAGFIRDIFDQDVQATLEVTQDLLDMTRDDLDAEIKKEDQLRAELEREKLKLKSLCDKMRGFLDELEKPDEQSNE